MIVLRSLKGLKGVKNPILTLGNFDGIHLGHRRIISRVVAKAEKESVPSVVYTFEPHPLKVVAPHRSPPLLLDMEDKRGLIKELGIDYLVLAEFTKEFAATHPRQFVEDVLIKGLKVMEVWVGHDFSFGRGRTGTAEYLRELGEELGFKVRVMPAYRKAGLIVSSSLIRELIKTGEVRKAASLLGKDYRIKGRVVKGASVGREIGFPTANLRVSSELVPKNGVYAAYASVGGVRRAAVLNIGTAPTFGGREKTVEVHILGFRGDIYGRKMEVAFVRRLRDEKTFKTKAALISRIRRDALRAREILEG
ncbi:MAG: bifunctional riboflavin kinase/FAD synthetase [Deltaproteobacteria bacterium]|nr:bifunctional riboflavin kinase/FAD synthetase [Deltaproteobacteria bacterium]